MQNIQTKQITEFTQIYQQIGEIGSRKSRSYLKANKKEETQFHGNSFLLFVVFPWGSKKFISKILYYNYFSLS